MAFNAEQKKAWRARPEVAAKIASYGLQWFCKKNNESVDEVALRRLRDNLAGICNRKERIFRKSLSMFVTIGRGGLKGEELKKVRDKFRVYTPEHKARTAAYKKTPKGRASLIANHRRRWANDAQYRISHSLRTSLRNRVTRYKGVKAYRSVKLFGCTTQYLRRHIESQWSSWMNWDNYGKSWCIDHIVPCKAFNLKDPVQQLICFNWQNLRPLSVKKNGEKSDSITLPQLHLPLQVPPSQIGSPKKIYSSDDVVPIS
jgi:hypothetical protein